MMNTDISRTRFTDFYYQIFLSEHSHRGTVALHVLGTLAGLLYVPAVLVYSNALWLLLFPVVHATPGLIGHRLFERNAAVGDVRVTRTDFPKLWFIFANHWLTFMLLTGTLAQARKRTV